MSFYENRQHHRRKPTDEYSTPQRLFDHYNAIYRFDLDAAASHANHKCGRYFTKEIDALSRRWFGRVWLNPPYSAIGKFMEKALIESRLGATVVCLLPAWTEKAWFHQIVAPNADVILLRVQVRFNGPCQTKFMTTAMIAIFNGKNRTMSDITRINASISATVQ